jgi:hypothetical protein
MWIFFDHLWYTSSRHQVVDKLISILRLMAKAPTIITAATSPDEARHQATQFRRNLSNNLDEGRLLLDETKIELTLALKPSALRGNQLELMATEVSFAAFLLIALNEKKLRAHASGTFDSIQPLLQPTDEALAQSFANLAITFQSFAHQASQSDNIVASQPSVPYFEVPFPDSGLLGQDLRSIYKTLQDGVKKLSSLEWIVQRLP